MTPSGEDQGQPFLAHATGGISPMQIVRGWASCFKWSQLSCFSNETGEPVRGRVVFPGPPRVSCQLSHTHNTGANSPRTGSSFPTEVASKGQDQLSGVQTTRAIFPMVPGGNTATDIITHSSCCRAIKPRHGPQLHLRPECQHGLR